MDESPERRSTQLVVVGSSAGGVNALSTLIASLPADFPAPLVLAQHLDPHHPSQLAEILASRGSLAVRIVTDIEPLIPGTAYVVPADRDIEITDHHVRIRSAESRSRPSVDRLLESAARVFAEDLVAIILTGSGIDGSAGAQAVKAFGGTVIIENPDTAAFSSMPASVPASVVDIVADLDEIGPLLINLVSGDGKLQDGDDESELREILARVRDRSGLDFDAYKRPTIVRRLQRRMAAVGTPSLRDYRRYLQRHPEEMARLVATFLIKVTMFFRDPQFFGHLRDRVVPQLIDEARERGELRIWSAGCATGEEAYTLAMLVAEQLGDELDSIPVRIFATDVATDAIDYARRGVYPSEALSDLPSELVERYFTQYDGRCEVRKSLRGLVVFGDHDLGVRAPFPRIDLVLCRNVLIYFTADLQRRALERFAFSLRQGGFLALGKAETVSTLPEFFSPEDLRLKIYRRVGESIPLPVEQILDLSAFSVGRRINRPAFIDRRSPGFRGSVDVTTGEGSAYQVPEQLLDQLAAGVVTVDQRYDIRSLNIAGRRLLGLHGATIGTDIVHSVSPSLAPKLRAGLDTALDGTPTTFQHQVVDDVLDDGARDLKIDCTPTKPMNVDAKTSLVTIVVTDVTELVRRDQEYERERDQVRTELDREIDRSARAVGEVRDLRNRNELLAADVGRLRIEIELLQLSNEEMQAAAEEIETLNEEAQATNEEFETLNEELQATVEELGTANEELQSRGFALQEIIASREQERERLEAVLTSIGDAVLVLDASGQVVMMNAAYRQMFGRDSNFVAEDEHGNPLPADAQPAALTARGEAFDMIFMIVGSDGVRHWYEATGQPLDGDGATTGGVASIRDITERSLRQLQDQWLGMAAHELRTPVTALQILLQIASRQSDPTMSLPYVSKARVQVQRITRLVSDLVEASRLQSGQLAPIQQPVDLRLVIQSAVETARLFTDRQVIELEAGDSPVWVTGDATRLEQVVLNLLTNAIAYAPEADRIDVRLRQDDDHALIEVQDYGQGIPADDLDRVFARYFRSGSPRGDSATGLGLGLFIAREVVNAHGGDIQLESEEGAGATFTVRIPARRDGSPSG